MKEHLRGLRRASPCCAADVYHPHHFNVNPYRKALQLHCAACQKKIKYFLLINSAGEVVWPPPKEWIADTPPQNPRKRNRRKPQEADPIGYRIILPGSRH